MNVLKIALIACTLSAAAMAHAQTAPSAADQQLAQTSAQRASGVAGQGRAATPAAVKAKAEECVGPVSFCTLYFGS